jgi:hypothetical protein
MDFKEHSETFHFFNLLAMGAGVSGNRTVHPPSEGEHIAIDTDMTREHDSEHSFILGSVINLGRSSIALSGEGGFQGNIEEIAALREMQARANE